MAALVALQGNAPQIDTMGSFANGAQARQAFDANSIKQGLAGIEMIARGAAYATGGKKGAPADPAKWAEVVDGVAKYAPEVAQYRDRPDLAPMVLDMSISTADQIRMAQDEKTYQLAMDKFEAELANAAKGPAPTDDQREYQMAVEQGYKGSLMEFMRDMKSAGATQVNVGPNGENYGDPGKGLVWQRGADGKVMLDDRGAPIAIPFQGGEAWQEQQAAAAAAGVKGDAAGLKADIVTQDVDRALAKIKDSPEFTTGFFGKWLAEIGGTEATNVKRLIETVKANAGFNELAQMRASSPTGAALGNVTEKELAFLQATIGSLEQDQTGDQLIQNLERVKEAFLDIVHGPGNRPDGGGSPGGGPAAAGSPGGDLPNPADMSDEELMLILGAE